MFFTDANYIAKYVNIHYVLYTLSPEELEYK